MCPSIHPAHIQQVSGGHFQKVPSTKPSGYFLNKPPSLFGEVSTKYPSIWSQCAHWALWEFFESLWENWATLRVCCGYFTKNPVGTLWLNCWAHCERTQRVLSQNTLWVLCGQFTKEQRGFVQKVPTGFCAGYFVKVPTTYLLGISQANWWALFESTHYLPTGYEPGKLFQNPQLTHNVPTGYIALHP